MTVPDNNDFQTPLLIESLKVVYSALLQYRAHSNLFKSHDTETILKHEGEIGELLFLLQK